MAEALTAHSSNIGTWTDEWVLIISAPKSTIAIFTSQFTQSNTHPDVTLNNFLLLLERYPAYWESLSTLISLPEPISILVTRVSTRININQSLVGTNWGKQKESIFITYVSPILFLFMYVVPIWFPNASLSLVEKLQTVEYSALRAATGCVKGIYINHLHEETKILPVQDHLSLICS